MKLALLFVLAFLASCESSGPRPQPAGFGEAMTVFRIVGESVLRVDGYAAIAKYAPELVALVDVDADKVVTMAELEKAVGGIPPTPESVAGLLAAAYAIYKR